MRKFQVSHGRSVECELSDSSYEFETIAIQWEVFESLHLQRLYGQCFCISIDEWMTCNFTSFLKVFQSYQDDGRMKIKSCMQWDPAYGWPESFSPPAGLHPGIAKLADQRLTYSASVSKPRNRCSYHHYPYCANRVTLGSQTEPEVFIDSRWNLTVYVRMTSANMEQFQTNS